MFAREHVTRKRRVHVRTEKLDLSGSNLELHVQVLNSDCHSVASICENEAALEGIGEENAALLPQQPLTTEKCKFRFCLFSELFDCVQG